MAGDSDDRDDRITRRAREHGLTPRQEEILRVLLEPRLALKEVAAELAITLSTLKDHEYKILRAFDEDSRMTLYASFYGPDEDHGDAGAASVNDGPG